MSTYMNSNEAGAEEDASFVYAAISQLEPEDFEKIEMELKNRFREAVLSALPSAYRSININCISIISSELKPAVSQFDRPRWAFHLNETIHRAQSELKSSAEEQLNSIADSSFSSSKRRKPINPTKFSGPAEMPFKVESIMPVVKKDVFGNTAASFSLSTSKLTATSSWSSSSSPASSLSCSSVPVVNMQYTDSCIGLNPNTLTHDDKNRRLSNFKSNLSLVEPTDAVDMSPQQISKNQDHLSQNNCVSLLSSLGSNLIKNSLLNNTNNAHMLFDLVSKNLPDKQSIGVLPSDPSPPKAVPVFNNFSDNSVILTALHTLLSTNLMGNANSDNNNALNRNNSHKFFQVPNNNSCNNFFNSSEVKVSSASIPIENVRSDFNDVQMNTEKGLPGLNDILSSFCLTGNGLASSNSQLSTYSKGGTLSSGGSVAAAKGVQSRKRKSQIFPKSSTTLPPIASKIFANNPSMSPSPSSITISSSIYSSLDSSNTNSSSTASMSAVGLTNFSNLNGAGNSPGVKTFRCNQCKRIFSSLNALCEHTFETHGSFRCTICGSKFTQRSNLQRHALKHVGFKPFECAICGKAYFRKDHSIRHVEVTHPQWDPKSSIKCHLTSSQCLDFLEAMEKNGRIIVSDQQQLAEDISLIGKDSQNCTQELKKDLVFSNPSSLPIDNQENSFTLDKQECKEFKSTTKHKASTKPCCGSSRMTEDIDYLEANEDDNEAVDEDDDEDEDEEDEEEEDDEDVYERTSAKDNSDLTKINQFLSLSTSLSSTKSLLIPTFQNQLDSLIASSPKKESSAERPNAVQEFSTNLCYNVQTSATCPNHNSSASNESFFLAESNNYGAIDLSAMQSC